MTPAGFGDIPLPTPSDLVPMMPGALLGAGLAFASTFVARRRLRLAICVAAATAPWLCTWAVTHDNSLPLLSSGTSSERAALALLLWTVVTIGLPAAASLPRTIAIAVLRWVATATAIGWVLWTFLTPNHPFAVSVATVAMLGVLGLATGAIAFATNRLHAAGPTAALAAIGSALGLLLVGISETAALSQVVAATSMAAGVTSGLMLIAGRQPLEPGLVAAWLAAAVFAGVDANATADDRLPVVSLGLLGLAIAVPWLAGLRRFGERRLRPAMLVAGVSGALAALAVAAGVWSTGSDTSSGVNSSDPYGGLESYK